jgi:hypothetical protein
MQPAFLLAWQAMKSALPPTVQRERLFPDEALKPTLTELIKTSSLQA